MSKELQFLMYNTPEEDVSINAVVKDETIWLTQKGMADLFGVEVPAISKHFSNIFAEGELPEESTLSKMEIVQQEGNRQVKRNLDFYKAEAEYAVFNKTQRFTSDFDRAVKKMLQKGAEANE